MSSIERPSATGGEPARGKDSADTNAAGGGLGGFETRLLSELQMVVAEQAAVAGPAATRRAGWFRDGRAWPRPVVTGAFSAALAAGLAVGLIVTSTGAGTGSAVTHFAPATTVAAILDNAAAAALGEPAIKPRAGQFVYTSIRSEVNLPITKQTIETWTSVGGTRVGAQVVSGPTTNGEGQVNACVNGFVQPPYPSVPPQRTRCTAGQFAAYRPWLPTTTAGMLAYLKRTSSPDGSIAQGLIEQGYQLLWSLDLTPAQQVAMYHALAEVPGLSVVPKVTDILGRAGVGIRSYLGRKGTWTIIFSRTTFQPLGLDIHAEVGTRYIRRAMVVQATIVNKVRQRP